MSEKRENARSFGALATFPPEIRNIIYKLVLIDPPKWDRPHRAEYCRHIHSHGHCRYDCFQYDCNLTFQQNSCCRGRLRTGMSLLRVSKAINDEASPIFLKENIFCFLSKKEFVECVGTNLRYEDRGLLRHIYILRAVRLQYNVFGDEWWDWEPSYEKKNPFEAVIRQCTGLRTLGMDINAISPRQLSQECLDKKHVQELAGIVSPRVHFSFLRLIPTPLQNPPAWPIRRTIPYTQVQQMPYNLHNEAVIGEMATSDNIVILRDWKLV